MLFLTSKYIFFHLLFLTPSFLPLLSGLSLDWSRVFSAYITLENITHVDIGPKTLSNNCWFYFLRSVNNVQMLMSSLL